MEHGAHLVELSSASHEFSLFLLCHFFFLVGTYCTYCMRLQSSPLWVWQTLRLLLLLLPPCGVWKKNQGAPLPDFSPFIACTRFKTSSSRRRRRRKRRRRRRRRRRRKKRRRRFLPLYDPSFPNSFSFPRIASSPLKIFFYVDLVRTRV